MKKEKLVTSLIVMIVLMIVLTCSSFASGEPTTITTIKTANSTNSTNTANSTTVTNIPTAGQGSGTITPINSASNSLPIESSSKPANSSTQLSVNGGNNTATVNNSETSSSYRNIASNTTSNLPYTGSSYGVVFVIVALVISAVYAYKKVSDYNM